MCSSDLEKGNVFYVASDQAELKCRRPASFDHVHPIMRREVELAFESLALTDPNRGRVMTDDFNPVEYYDAEQREYVRRMLASTLKSF